ncbi:hypothetical protein CPBF426_05670 [Xanthomonas arboricola pv. juglandis]|uniref:hypothetical protein n=1 Tax=Xanthomonas TaxID=338 RepID=UPI000E856E98|nr:MULTISPECIES: hypothetical protein [Xanthomonas]MBB5768445.1 hypothetical protein [Xanthomonas euroxanthea]CAD1794315.1 hypothetical protein XSP_002931 [Xanthomonas sp. CPBF 426]CAG2093308.1 hypothetical protein XCY_002892 [Xanthomonas euroxanthea]SYZ50326.1 hypothetical protein CPBF426_05670 [Xanthomonas arboricola pv. juglandis]
MSANRQFRVCEGVVLSVEAMQGYVLAMLHSDARPDASPVLIACEATGFDEVLPGSDAQSVVLGRLHVCMRVDAAVDVLTWLRKQARAVGAARRTRRVQSRVQKTRAR